MKKEFYLLIMVICAIATASMLTSCENDDEPTYTYSYWDSLKAIKVIPETTSVTIIPISQGDGVVLSPNKADLEDFESLGLEKLWDLNNFDSNSEYKIGDVRCKCDWGGFIFNDLQPNATYYYRVITMGTSTVGNDVTEYKIIYGDIYSFTTLPEN